MRAVHPNNMKPRTTLNERAYKRIFTVRMLLKVFTFNELCKRLLT